jgi:uncharacterized membrane protein YeaQ/YmgE (transglycosylase-associated protein family)
MGLIAFLIIGAISGWISGELVFGDGFGLVTNIIVGIIGAVIGGFVLGMTDSEKPRGFFGQIVTSVLGAVILLLIINLLR